MRTPCNGNGLFKGESRVGAAARGRAGWVSRGRASSAAIAAVVSSPSRGARRPAFQLVPVESQRLTG